jgi:hypothetical protein
MFSLAEVQVAEARPESTANRDLESLDFGYCLRPDRAKPGVGR